MLLMLVMVLAGLLLVQAPGSLVVRHGVLG
jgi:hypothetical protein